MSQTLDTLQEDMYTRTRWQAWQFFAMEQKNILNPERRYELLDGKIYPKLPLPDAHGYTLSALLGLFSRMREVTSLRTRCTLIVDAYNVPEPDLMLLRSEKPITSPDGYLQVQGIEAIIEVVCDTLHTDLQIKPTIYAKAGVSFYWVADVRGKRLLVHTNPTETGYQIVTALAEADTLHLSNGDTVPVASLFGQELAKE